MKRALLTIILFIICIVLFCVILKNSELNYTKIYLDFYENKLSEFLQENQNIDADITEETKQYILDLRNTGKPELVLVYGEHQTENLVIKYENGQFLPGEPIDLETNIGSGGSEYKIVMSKEGKTYYYEYKTKRLEYGENNRWAIDSQIYTYENGKKRIVERLASDNGVDYWLNNEKISFDFSDYNPIKDYEIIIDSRDFVLR